MSEFATHGSSFDETELMDKYGVLLRNIEAYFPTADDPEDRSEDFIREYRMVGEQNIRFAGVEEQLKLAIKKHVEFSQVLNAVTGYDLTPAQTSEYMIDLYNRLTGTDEGKIKAKADPDALMSYYAARSVNLPFNLPYFGNRLPLWALLIVSLIISGIGWLGVTFLKFPVVEQIFLGVLVIGALGMLYSALTMYFLRDEVINADRYQDREVALQQYRAAKQQKRSTSRWRLPSIRG